MPRVAKDNYKDAKIYKLTATGTTECYIGSTCSTLAKRLYSHNWAVANPETQKQTAACLLYQEGKTVAIELLEDFPCTSKQELGVRERHWIENTPTAINKNIPGQTWQERAAKRETEIKEYMAFYRAIKITCGCGSEFGQADKSRHEKSQTHLAWAASAATPPQPS